MVIRYEINPPKVFDSPDRLEVLLARIEQISKLCDGIHLTDSVLGVERLSPLILGTEIKHKFPELNITISLRVIDKNLKEISSLVEASIKAKLDGVLVLMGDPSKTMHKNSGVIPSKAVQELVNSHYNDKIEIFLSLPSNPNFEKITKKIIAKPNGFVTQVIQDISQVQRISSYLQPKEFRIIPCVLYPSEKNSKSADFLNLNWSSYDNNFSEFVKKIEQITNDVLLTSPNDFKGALEFLTRLQND